MTDPRERRANRLRAGAILTGVAALLLFVLESLGISTLPLFVPLLLLVAASGLMLASRQGAG